MVFLMRVLVANLLSEYPDVKIEGLPIAQVFDQSEYRNLDDYIERCVLTMGQELQDLGLELLPIVLRVKIVTQLMDRNAGE